MIQDPPPQMAGYQYHPAVIACGSPSELNYQHLDSALNLAHHVAFGGRA